ncbi:DUF3604 domain-containing protein [Pseudohalioglobus sediminis]|uniref:DUF3604 domain-containing protein n=1 Tax=Pseudohalioglobus sediminis TaxID=2606449 RepID=A0A5B0WZT5_9GAMM|nr:DUF3604 domain-containing protein [Pseudohalioglobus sediminis]KAA1191905.1 DUF3604 domain-containing protein [Pseudohalioglobus sediminis]
MHNNYLAAVLAAAVLAVSGTPSNAQIPAPADASILSNEYTGKVYSPYAGRDFATGVYWGDTHLHTDISMDAGAFGNRLGLEAAYRFARGEEVESTNGGPVRLSRPLDFLVIADHSDNMGFFPDMFAGAEHILSDPTGKDWYERIKRGEGVGVALELIGKFSQGEFPEALIYKPDSKPYKDAWAKTVAAAERFNDPGKFTAFIGYEWTSLVRGNNMHRVVIYKDDGDKGGKMVPYTTIAPEGSTNPRDLWTWMESYEKTTGGNVLAIAHNGNLANGIMFPMEVQNDGKAIDVNYVERRAKWEPLYEVTQIKGDGETHPLLSPDDEFADYETWDIGNLDVSEAKTDDMIPGEYAREALKRGLVLEESLGTNPYKFGMIGSTDSHTSLAAVQEDNFFGKHSGSEPGPERMTHPFMSNDNGTIMGWQQVASGLAAVWARDNTRAALFEAMERKEVYATTGSRLSVRFFGGWEFEASDLNNRQPAFAGYEKGVPMGGDLPPRAKAKSPSFMVYALRDTIGANLDRIQIVKGWQEGGKTMEKVYDVVWAGDRKPGKDGKLPPVGDTVDARTASWTNTIGASELGTVWTDPDFDPQQRAFYYARVLEIPTPRWTTHDAFRFGIDIPEGAPVSTQERAYTSPIWYTP